MVIEQRRVAPRQQRRLSAEYASGWSRELGFVQLDRSQRQC
jgi:hypothetical protein